jgi:hypothetical protein
MFIAWLKTTRTACTVLAVTLSGLFLVLFSVQASAFEFNYDEADYDKTVKPTTIDGPSREVIESQAGVTIDELDAAEKKQTLEDLMYEDVPENKRKYTWYDWRTSLKHCLTKTEAFRKGYGQTAQQERCDGGKDGKKSY